MTSAIQLKSRRRTARLMALSALVLVCSFVSTAAAHDPSKTYIDLNASSGQLTGHLDIPVRDLEMAVPDDSTAALPGTPASLEKHEEEIARYVRSHFQVGTDGGEIPLQFAEPSAEDLSGGRYLRFELAPVAVPSGKSLDVSYRLFFGFNSLHRGLLRLQSGDTVQVSTFSPGNPTRSFNIGTVAPGRQFLVFLHEGIWHIWTGLDHILFLLALLLPSVLEFHGGRWREAGSLRAAFVNVLKIVTAFTLAHSLTLTLATLGIVRLPSRFTESVIAFSVVIAAANNLWPVLRERGWMAAMAFGLIHGFGFASALTDLGLSHGSLVLSLVGFNLGVEIGQLAIVAAFIPLAYALRRTWTYQIPVLRLGSACIVLIAASWCAERALDLKFMPF